MRHQHSIRQPIRLQEQWEDEESGLYYNRYRYYDPAMGRYITQDPIGLAGGMNVFCYAKDNPLSEIDPLGLFVPNLIGAVGGAVFGGAAGFWYTVTTTCDGFNLSTADWGAVLENTLVGAAGGALTGATFGAATAGGAALGGVIIGSSFGMNAGQLSILVKGAAQ